MKSPAQILTELLDGPPRYYSSLRKSESLSHLNRNSSRSLNTSSSNITYFRQQTPLVLEGSRVIELEYNLDCNPLNLRIKHDQSRSVPQLQNDDIVKCLKLCAEAKLQGKEIIAKSNEKFECHHLQGPVLEITNPPLFLEKAGPQLDQKLLTPKDQRRWLEYMKQKNYAYRVMQQELRYRNRTVKQLEKIKSCQGMSVVPVGNDKEAVVINTRAQEHVEKKLRRGDTNIKRANRLAQLAHSIQTHGNILVPDTISDRACIEKLFQDKSRGIQRNIDNQQNTHQRIFENNEMSKPNINRMQNIRNNELYRKNYDIVTHTIVI